MKWRVRHEAKRTNFYRGEATLHSQKLLHKRSDFMRHRRASPKKALAFASAFFWCTFRVTEEKTIDNRFFEDVTEIRSASREATPRGEGDYISGRKNPVPGSSVKGKLQKKNPDHFRDQDLVHLQGLEPGTH